MALSKIDTAGIGDNAITSDKILSGAVSAADIEDSTITAAKLYSTLDLSGKTITMPSNSIGSGNISDGAITDGKLASTLDLSGKTVTYGLSGSDLPTGSILQVLQTVKTDTFSVAGTTPTTITGLTVDITPTSASSKFLILSDVTLGTSGFDVHLILKRNSTSIYIADTAGTYRPTVTKTSAWYSATEDQYSSGGVPVMYLDSPSTTSQITYGFTLNHYASGGTAYVNRTHRDADNSGNYDIRTASSITVMEIAG